MASFAGLIVWSCTLGPVRRECRELQERSSMSRRDRDRAVFGGGQI